MMSIVHDLAEAQGIYYPKLLSSLTASLVGDITPREGFSKSEKNRLESASVETAQKRALTYD